MRARGLIEAARRTALLIAAGLAFTACQQAPSTEAVARSMPVSVVEHAPEHDIALLIKVKNALLADPELKGLEVGVQGGVVTLYGEVATPQQRAKAERVARNIRGVATVKSGIAVASAT